MEPDGLKLSGMAACAQRCIGTETKQTGKGLQYNMPAIEGGQRHKPSWLVNGLWSLWLQ